MHLNWVNPQLPGSKEGARDSPRCCRLLQRDSRSRCLHPAPHRQSHRTSAAQWAVTGSHKSLRNGRHHMHKVQAQTVRSVEIPEPSSPYQLEHWAQFFSLSFFLDYWSLPLRLCSFIPAKPYNLSG